MWLPETAVSERVLAVLAAEGIRFTILAPHQLDRVRRLGGSAPWSEVGHGRARPGHRSSLPLVPSRPTRPVVARPGGLRRARWPRPSPSATRAPRPWSTRRWPTMAAGAACWPPPPTVRRSVTTARGLRCSWPERSRWWRPSETSPCPDCSTCWSPVRPPTRPPCARARGHAPTASVGGCGTADATPGARRAGTRSGASRCATRSIGSVTAEAR